MSKTCRGCKRARALTKFWRSARSPDGRLPRCIDCQRAYNEKHSERIAATAKRSYGRHREQRREAFRVYAIKNRAHLLARAKTSSAERRAMPGYKERFGEYYRNWQRRNREKLTAYLREWRARDPEAQRVRAAAMKAAHRARKAASAGRPRAHDIRKLLDRQKWKCRYCGASLREARHIDHIVPLARGGSSDPSNLQALCPPCNLSKGTRTHEEFVLRRSVA